MRVGDFCRWVVEVEGACCGLAGVITDLRRLIVLWVIKVREVTSELLRGEIRDWLAGYEKYVLELSTFKKNRQTEWVISESIQIYRCSTRMLFKGL